MAIYYLSHDHPDPSGGIRVLYRHVDILRRNGIEAYVAHERRGFRCSWFDNQTPVRSWSARRTESEAGLPKRAARRAARAFRRHQPAETFLAPPAFELTDDDVVVVPELFGPRIGEIAPGTRKLIFIQGPYLAFHGYPPDPRAVASPYRHQDVAGALVISEDARAFVEHAFPGVRAYRVRLSIDETLFYRGETKERQIAFMPRRGAADADHVLAVLAARGTLRDYEIVRIDGLDERAAAAVLRKTAVFLSLGYYEGLGRPPAEAMACGAIVVGYDGFGGREFLTDDHAFPVPTGDLRTFAATLEEVLRRFEDEPETMAARAVRAADFVRAEFSREREEEELVSVWSALLGSPA